MSWPFSEGITVTLIELIGAVLVAVIGVVLPLWLKHKKSKPTKVAPPIAVQPEPLPVPAVVSKPTTAPISSPPVPRPAVTAITIMEIVENIERVPPFQQDDIHKHYVGMRVKWPATLRSVSRFKDESLHVTVKFTERDTLGFCRATVSDVHGLVHAPEGTLVEVEGAIEWISKYEASMVDCVITPSPLNSGPYGVLLRKSPREAMTTAWSDVERTALLLLDAKVTRTSSDPIPIGAVAKTLQMYGALNTGQYDKLLQLAEIQEKLQKEPNAEREARSAPGYCAVAADLIAELRAR